MITPSFHLYVRSSHDIHMWIFLLCVGKREKFDTRTALKTDLEPRKLDFRQLYLQLNESHKGKEHQRNTF